MRLLKLVSVLFLTVIITTGCYKNGNTENNPVNLFDQLPVYNQEKKDISDEVKKISGSTNLILPYNSIETGKINQVDLDNDKKKEVVFFQRREDIKNEVGFTILDSKNEFYDTTYTEQGDKIKYANFYDMDNDNHKEIILVVEEKNVDTLAVCKYKNEKIETIISKTDSDYFNTDKYSKLNVLVEDIDNDKQLELIVYNYSYSKKQLNLNVCRIKNNKINIVDTLSIKDVKNFDDIKITSGKINKKDKALFLSIPSSKEEKYITKIICLKDDKLIDTLKDSQTSFTNEYYIPFEDVNNDGITNVPIIDEDSINIDTLSSNTYPNSMIISWKKYNEKNAKDADLIFVNQIYYNYELRFKFLIQNNLVGKISISEKENKDLSNYKTFDFYYDNSSEINTSKKKNKRNLLFSLNLTEKNVADDTKNVNKASGDIIFENSSYMFTILNINQTQFKELGLNVNILKEYFSEIK